MTSWLCHRVESDVLYIVRGRSWLAKDDSVRTCVLSAGEILVDFVLDFIHCSEPPLVVLYCATYCLVCLRQTCDKVTSFYCLTNWAVIRFIFSLVRLCCFPLRVYAFKGYIVITSFLVIKQWITNTSGRGLYPHPYLIPMLLILPTHICNLEFIFFSFKKYGILIGYFREVSDTLDQVFKILSNWDYSISCIVLDYIESINTRLAAPYLIYFLGRKKITILKYLTFLDYQTHVFIMPRTCLTFISILHRKENKSSSPLDKRLFMVIFIIIKKYIIL